MTTANPDYEADATAEDEAEHLFDPRQQIEVRPPTTGPMTTLAVRLDAPTIDQLRAVALRQGLGVTQLVRHWLTDRLSEGEHEYKAPDVAIDKVIGELTEIVYELRSSSPTNGGPSEP